MTDKTLIMIIKESSTPISYTSSEEYDITLKGVDAVLKWPVYLSKVRVMRTKEENAVVLTCTDPNIVPVQLQRDLDFEIEAAASQATWIMKPGRGTPDEHLEEVQDRMNHADI